MLLAGIKLFERQGFVEAEQMIEDLIPFMDIGPKVSPPMHERACKRRHKFPLQVTLMQSVKWCHLKL